MFGTVLLFVLLTPGVLVTLNLGFKQKLAPVIIHAVIFAFLLANYRSIPLLNMIEPFQARKPRNAGSVPTIAPEGTAGGKCRATNPKCNTGLTCNTFNTCQ